MKDKQYITDLLKKDHRDLDLYSIADIIRAIDDDTIDEWQEAQTLEEDRKDKFSAIRKVLRDELVKEGKKPTESLLEDLVRTSEAWDKWKKEYIEKLKKSKKMKDKINMWTRYFTARMMRDSAEKKNVQF